MIGIVTGNSNNTIEFNTENIEGVQKPQVLVRMYSEREEEEGTYVCLLCIT